jgi:hypothetical protein
MARLLPLSKLNSAAMSESFAFSQLPWINTMSRMLKAAATKAKEKKEKPAETKAEA